MASEEGQDRFEGLLILFITYIFIFETGSNYVTLFVLELVI